MFLRRWAPLPWCSSVLSIGPIIVFSRRLEYLCGDNQRQQLQPYLVPTHNWRLQPSVSRKSPPDSVLVLLPTILAVDLVSPFYLCMSGGFCCSKFFVGQIICIKTICLAGKIRYKTRTASCSRGHVVSSWLHAVKTHGHIK